MKIGAVVLALGLLALLLRSISGAEPGSWPDVPGWLTRRRARPAGRRPGRRQLGAGAGAAVDPARPVLAALAVCAAFAVAFAWLFAWPYVLPWYDGLAGRCWRCCPWSRLDWLLLARTTALALGYLPGAGGRDHDAVQPGLAAVRGQDRRSRPPCCSRSW